jgi:type IV fimbrial biogenesis protein FimT
MKFLVPGQGPKRVNAHSCSGYSMIELLITVVIISILAVIAVPSFQNLMARNRVATQANEFVTDLNLARSEAIKRGQRISICKSEDGVTCTTDDGWDQGWIVFINTGSTIAVADVNDILRVRPALQGGSTLTGAGEVADYISFVPSGFSRQINGRTQSGTVTLSSTGTDQEFSILINNAGRVRTEKS